MSEYKTIHGQKVQVLSSDPSNPQNGQVWYNTTTNILKVSNIQTGGAWSSGGNLSQITHYGGGAGTQTAGLAFGGQSYNGNRTEEYDGTSWTIGGNLGSSYYDMGDAGTQTAALSIAGTMPFPVGRTEEYDGSSWTTGGNMSIGERGWSGTGAQTAALAVGSDETSTEEYDGSSWTAGGTYPEIASYVGMAGSLTAAIVTGGLTYSPSPTSTNHYNGTSFSAGGTMSTGRYLHAMGGAGTQTASLVFGGDPSIANTEHYDGTSWTTGGNMSTGRGYLAGAGTLAAGLAIGGAWPGVNSTEEYAGPGPVVESITTS